MQLVLYWYPSQLRVGCLEQLRWPSLIFMPDISNYLAGSWATKHESHRKPTVSSRDHLQVHSQKPYCWSLSSNILNQVDPPKMEPWKIVVGFGYVWMSRLPGIDWCRQREASATKLVSLACTRLGDLELQSCSNKCQVLLPERQVVWAWAVLLKMIVGDQMNCVKWLHSHLAGFMLHPVFEKDASICYWTNSCTHWWLSPSCCRVLLCLNWCNMFSMNHMKSECHPSVTNTDPWSFTLTSGSKVVT